MTIFDGGDATPAREIDLWIANASDNRSLSGIDLWREKLPGDIGPFLDMAQGCFWEYLARKYPVENLREVLRSLLPIAAQQDFLDDFLEDATEQTDEIAVFGLILVNRLANAAREGKNGWEYHLQISSIAECEQYVCLALTGTKSMAELIAKDRIREVARAAGTARHARTPQAAAKVVVRECWQAWEATPSQYGGSAAFARAMLDKFPDELRSQQVIERWVREWRSDID